ncbi:MAG: preprotein translocase subunit SecE [Phycisphaerae bacterium]|nr:preprotein translocase subunit SecE [Phycisphaerae bacterium]
MGLEIYKRGQGTYTRLGTGLAGAVILGLGCVRLYEKLGVVTNNLWLQSMIPAVVFVVLAGLLYWVLNKPAVADFMISAEGEIKKVSWSSRQEIMVSTLIVVLVVGVLAVLLGTTDLVLRLLFQVIFPLGA